jgi:serine/threonine protein phosphatase PrpC
LFQGSAANPERGSGSCRAFLVGRGLGLNHSRTMDRGGTALLPPPTPMSQRSLSTPGPKTKSYMGAYSLQSFGKGTNENQDAYVASGNGNKFLTAVFDGHGEKGKRISEFAKSTLSKSLFAHKELHNDPRGALEAAYRDTQNQIERTHGPDAAESGTTAVACYQHRDRLLIANVGDSRAVLGRCDTARKSGLKAVELTSDQKPSRPDEKARVLALGGKVDQMCFPVWNGRGGVRLMRGGPERVMDSSGFGGLAMSRSLGDLSLRPYVSSQPEVFERKLDSKDRFLVLGSDGVWDQLSSQEAVDIASRVSDPNQAAREITNQARRRWQSETEGLLSDDITAVVVRLEHDNEISGASTATAGQSRTSQNLSRTDQNFFRARPGSGAATPAAHAGDRRDGGNRMDRLERLDRSDRNQSNRLSQTIGGPSGFQRESFPSLGQRRSGNHSEGNRNLARSRSEPGLGQRGRHTFHGAGSMRRNDLMPAAGR